MEKLNKHPQRRLRLFLVAAFLLVTAVNLGRYIVLDGLYFWDAKVRWQECVYVLHGVNPFSVARGAVPPLPSVGVPDATVVGTVPWGYVIGNLFNPGILPYRAMCVYILALDAVLAVAASAALGRWLYKNRYVGDLFTARLAGLLVMGPSMWANAVLFGNQSGAVCCLIVLALCVLERSEVAAGLLLAAAMSKPQIAFVFLLPLVCKRRWKAFLTTSAVVLAAWGAAALATGCDPYAMLLQIFRQGLSYTSSYYGLFNWLRLFGADTGTVLWLDVAAGLALFALGAYGLFRARLDDDWLAWFSLAAVVSVLWFYKQNHDYIILLLPAVAMFCSKKLTLPVVGGIAVCLIDVIAYALPWACYLLFGLPRDAVYPWAKLLEALAITGTLYFVCRMAGQRAAALQTNGAP